ncbi:MAG: T9SS type A sorting domain-containing protein [bacterium]
MMLVLISVDGSGNVYVTGRSIGMGTSSDYMTIKYSQLTGISQNLNSIPNKFSLSQNYPNPFNPSTVISYQLSVSSFASLKVFDVLGNEVATLVNEKQNAGSYSVEWDASNFSSGIYFYKIESNGFVQTNKMTLLK